MKKNHTFLMFVVTAFLVLTTAGEAYAFSGGDGSAGAPYQISNCTELQAMQSGLDLNYVLANDIDCSDTVNWDSGAGFAPVGNLSMPFSGIFDGQNHTITGLFINRPTASYVGLFGASSNTIKNVGLVNANVTGDTSTGGLVGENHGAITNSYTTGSVTGNSVTGGLVAGNYGTLTNSYSAVIVGGWGYWSGGLAGGNSGAITNSYATGNVNGGMYAGGLVGGNGGAITNCYATGNVGPGAFDLGGLVGYNGGVITNSFSTGIASGWGSGGNGLVGAENGGTVVSSYWDIETNGYSTSLGGTGKTTAEMMQESTYENWDFVNIWVIQEGVGYPHFRDITPPVIAAHGNLTATAASAAGAVVMYDLPIATDNIDTGVTVTCAPASGSIFSPGDTTVTCDALDSDGNAAIPTTFTVTVTSSTAHFTGGDGSVGSPYQISNCTELQSMKSGVDLNYVLANDIDCSDTVNWNSGAGFVPVGNLSMPFSGIFDGQNHTITGLFINRPPINTPSSNYLGLFGASSHAIKNVGLVSVNITGAYYAGGLASENSGAITNSYATGKVNVTGWGGGLVGGNDGTIEHSYSTVSVISGYWGGGLVGANGGTLTNSYATGNVGGCMYSGGLVGANGGPITNSYSTGNADGCYDVGGLVGYNGGPITNSYSTGKATGWGGALGGLVGLNAGGVVTNSYWDMETSDHPTSDGGTGKTTAEMKQKSTYENWDFVNIWKINSNKNTGYPYLSWQTVNTTVDTTPPVAPNALDLQAASDTGFSDTDNITNDNTPSFDITGLEPNSTVTVYGNDNVLGTTVIPDGYTSGTFTPASPMNEGIYIITATQTDEAGNVSPISPAMVPSLIIDTTPPVIAAHGDVTVEATSASGAVVTYDLPTATDNYDASVIVTCTPVSGSVFPLGDTTVTCNATDLAGNSTTLATGTVQVVNTTPPVITAVADVTTGAASASGTVITYDLPTATDSYGASVTVTCNPAPGSTFPTGDTTVTCTAGATSTSFVVHVVDTTPPVIADHDDIAAEAASAAGAMVTYDLPTATDNYDASVIVTCTPVSGSTFSLGDTTVTCDAHDNAGNSAIPITFTVTVTQSTGTLVVYKDAIGGDGTFSLTGTGPGGSLSAGITTNKGTGSYEFDNLTPGNYAVTESKVPSGWQQIDNECNSVVVIAGETTTCTVTNVKNGTKNLNEIRSTKYEDRNGDGTLKDGAHHRLAGVTIYLDLNKNGKLDSGEPSIVTNKHGDYRFSSLPAGTYVVREVIQSGWKQTYPANGLYTITFSATGKISKKNDFGNFKLGNTQKKIHGGGQRP